MAEPKLCKALPYNLSGAIPAAPGETWQSVERALREGSRGLPGGDTLAQFIARHFGVRNKAGTPRLTEEQILVWADAFHRREGNWPRVTSGPIPEAPGETWERVDTGLREGLRGLKAGSSLARLLADRRGARNRAASPPLSHATIVVWAEAHRSRTGRWPTQASGPVADAPDETWRAINMSLRAGLRGLPGGDSLVQLLQRERGTGKPAP